ncbi:MerR family transcriptional regulator [Microcoleus sp. D3_18_C4]|uniref:MerR family transcriptional regulator n=1 Tax=Microcoleus sp. D3_18_C4 TaxID=3055335 RepID=UPI002FD094D0
MEERFFTTKQAAQIAGCTLRQLQYWRESGVVVPVITETGTGRSIYYSEENLVELAAMVYWLSVGFTFEVGREVLKTLKEQYPGLLSDREQKRLIFVKESQGGDSKLVEFDVEKVVAAWAEGKFVVPVWLDVIYGRLRERVNVRVRV